MEKLVLLLLWMAIALPGWAHSGNEGTIEGTVTDPSGAVIPSAAVRARNLNTSATSAGERPQLH